MMVLTFLLSGLAAGTILGLVTNLSSIGPIPAFLVSWLAICFAAGALKAKEEAVRRQTATFGKRLLVTFLTLLILSPAARQFMEHWKTAQGFWPTTFLVWVALIALMTVSVPVARGESETKPQPSAPPG